MSDVFREFADQNMHRVYPLIDSSTGEDTTGAFTIPTSLMTDIFLCAPNLPYIDITKFYVMNVTVRRFFLEITLGYDGVAEPLGSFKNIRVDMPLHSTYDFVPTEVQSNDAFTPLFFMTGQITIGSASDTVQKLGSWTFQPENAYVTPTRVSRGCLNVQYLQIDDRLLTGKVVIQEGANVQLEVNPRLVGGEWISVVTVAASLNATESLEINNDADILAALLADFGDPLLTVNGLYPDVDRNFTLLPADCTTIEDNQNGVVISNPCATPCCDEDSSIDSILTSIANLNLRYAQLKGYFDAQSSSINQLQNKLLVLGAEI